MVVGKRLAEGFVEVKDRRTGEREDVPVDDRSSSGSGRSWAADVGVRAVIFDWGGTLTPWHDVDLYAQWYAYSEVYDPENAAALARRLHDGEERRWRRQRETNGAVAAGALDQLFLDEGIDINGARHLRALGSYLDFWAPHTYADPDAKDVLAALKHRGYKVGVLSNTMWTARPPHRGVRARRPRRVHRRGGLHQRDPRRQAARGRVPDDPRRPRARSPEESVYVGDRLWDDIAGAQQVGMRAIWIPHSNIPGHQVPDDSAQPDAVAAPAAGRLRDRGVLAVGVDPFALPDVGTIVLLCLAAGLAGWVDAVSGGGGLLQLPALFLALPSAAPVEVLATNKASSILGTAAATATYARKAPPDVRTAMPMVVAAVVGAALGARHGQPAARRRCSGRSSSSCSSWSGSGPC